MNCPSCRGGMSALSLEGHLGRRVDLDICYTCQAFWFDGYESLQLAPVAVLELFRSIGSHVAKPAGALAVATACPRCSMRLMPIHDQQRSTKFEYRRCPQKHGRLITFFNFLREKDFVRPLSKPQIDELRRNVKAVNCSNCGAPVDLASGSACAHCGSPLSMLDLAQAESLVAALKDVSARRARVDPALPMSLERARRDVNTAFGAFDGEPGWYEHASSAGLVGAALEQISKWLK